MTPEEIKAAAEAKAAAEKAAAEKAAAEAKTANIAVETKKVAAKLTVLWVKNPSVSEFYQTSDGYFFEQKHAAVQHGRTLNKDATAVPTVITHKRT